MIYLSLETLDLFCGTITVVNIKNESCSYVSLYERLSEECRPNEQYSTAGKGGTRYTFKE